MLHSDHHRHDHVFPSPFFVHTHLLLLHFPEVELELLALEHIAVAAAALARATGDARVEPSSCELVSEVRVKLVILISELEFPHDVLALLLHLLYCSWL